MRKLHLKVIFYLTARYFLFLIIINTIFKEVKWVKWSDLNSAEDWFMFAWLFIVPVLIEVIIFTLPIKYGINRIEVSKNRIPYYLFFVIRSFQNHLIISKFLLVLFCSFCISGRVCLISIFQQVKIIKDE